MSGSAAVQRKFFTSSAFAVAGASTNTQKYGYKLLAWYKSRSLPVVPITPTSTSILDIDCVKSVDELDQAKLDQTSLSIVTPPKVSLDILKRALQQQKLNGLWLQPGAEDGDVKRFIEENEWLQERTVYGGPCVLVLGDKLRSEAANPKL